MGFVTLSLISGITVFFIVSLIQDKDLANPKEDLLIQDREQTNSKEEFLVHDKDLANPKEELLIHDKDPAIHN